MHTTTTTPYPRTFQHSPTYYHSILLTLISGLQQKLTDSQIAHLLNSKGLLSPTGKEWTSAAVKSSLFKLRHHREVRSALHRAMLQLVFDKLLTYQEVQILFAMRSQGLQ